jgi:hypothetical protein
MKLLSLILVGVLLAGCGGLPKMSLTPISADAKFGGEHDTGVQEDNMVKVQTGDTSQTEYVADTVSQTYNDIQEYPLWLILAFALAVGLALPSPLSAYAGWRSRRQMQKQIDTLTKMLAASRPTYTMKPEGNHPEGNVPSLM